MSNKIIFTNNKLSVPNTIEIPYISGDGIGKEIWEASQPVFDAAIKKIYGVEKKIIWKKCLAGREAYDQTGEWMPEASLELIKAHLVAIKGPLETPVAGGIRSLNVLLRQTFDLFSCVRPIKWVEGVPSPVKNPQNVDMVIFRENTEDIYSGIEWKAGSEKSDELIKFLQDKMGTDTIRFPENCGIGIKPISIEGSRRIVTSAIKYAIKHNLPSVTIAHKGNIQKYTEGLFRDVGYQVAEETFKDQTFTWMQYEAIKKEEGIEKANNALENAQKSGKVIVKDCIADAFFQNSLLNPQDYSVVVTTNLNGDYISDALAAQVGGIGISPGGNINYLTGYAIFEATHGTAPTIAGQKKANPCALLLSGVMLFRYIGWNEVADSIENAIDISIKNKTVTADFNMPNAKIKDTFTFAEEIIKNL
ncbi:NADP-dependent isocitrate dehydrogenase [Candidatus Marinamargulisbacteria bacterium SCGC AAA071-K20]|nr:NADP-dependent isocitrate dehydrogenase [Candidatus Marinamargulisbacteria bacterium SCGC AAA071-K20]